MSGFIYVVIALFIVCLLQQERRKKHSVKRTIAPATTAAPEGEEPETLVETFDDDAFDTVPVETFAESESIPEAPREDYFGEGETPEEHAEHMRRADEARAKEESEAKTTRRFSASDLRRAIVAREILDRPVSMR